MPGFDSFVDLYVSDPFFSHVLDSIKNGEKTKYLLEDGLLFKGNQLCIPDCSLRARIIQELHCEGHEDKNRMLHLVNASYYWPSI